MSRALKQLLGNETESAEGRGVAKEAEEMDGDDKEKDMNDKQSNGDDKSFTSRMRERVGGIVSLMLSYSREARRSLTNHTNNTKPHQSWNEPVYQCLSFDYLSEENKDIFTVPLESTNEEHQPWRLESTENEHQRDCFKSCPNNDRSVHPDKRDSSDEEPDSTSRQCIPSGPALQSQQSQNHLGDQFHKFQRKMKEKGQQIRHSMGKVTQLTASPNFNVEKTGGIPLQHEIIPCRSRTGDDCEAPRSSTENDTGLKESGYITETDQGHEHSFDSDGRDRSDESTDSTNRHTEHTALVTQEQQSESWAEHHDELKKKGSHTQRERGKLGRGGAFIDRGNRSGKEYGQRCKEKIPVKAWQSEFISHCFGMFDNCEVSYKDIENVVLIKGPKKQVLEHQLSVLTELKKLKEEALTLTPVTSHVLSSEKGTMYLKNVIDSGASSIRAFPQNGLLILAAKGTDVLTMCLDKLKSQLNYSETTTSNAAVPLKELINLQDKLGRDLLVVVSWSDDRTQIVVEGIKDDVLMSKKDVGQLIEKYAVHEEVFDVKGLQAKLLNRFYSYKIESWLENVESVYSAMTDSHISIKIRGNKNQLQQSHRKLQELKKNIQSKSWALKSEFPNLEDISLIGKGFDSEDMNCYIEHFEMKEKCLVIPQLPNTDLVSLPAKRHKSGKSTRTDISDEMAAPSQPKSKLCFNVTSTCQLVIKPYGDITKENSDVLVCVLNQKSMDLRRTKVGRAFNKASPTLWKDLQAQQKAQQPDDPVLVTKGSYSRLKCKAICHVILFPWNPNTSPAHLTKAVNCVLKKAAALGAQSVSFPALGCGRAFGFPESDMAKTVLACINAKSVGKGIQKIVLLAPHQDVFRKFRSIASTSFGAGVSQLSHSLGAVGGVAKYKDTDKDDDRSDEDGHESDEDGDESDENSTDEDSRVNGEEDLDAHFGDLQTGHPTNDFQICLMALHGRSIEELWLTLKENIRQRCLHVDYFNQKRFYYWPKDYTKRIDEEAKNLCVWVEIKEHPKTKKEGYRIKGTKKGVNKMLCNIMEEFFEICSDVPEGTNTSHTAPKRGTVRFLRHAVLNDELFPSYWSLGKEKTFWTKAKDLLKTHHKYLVDVDSKTKDAIKKLITQTWDRSLVGRGNDAAGLQHSGIKVVDVQRIENPQLFEQYRINRKMLLEKTANAGKICPDIGKLKGSKGILRTTEQLDDFMKAKLYWEINEHYLFHGTKADVLDALISNGIDPKVSSQDAMFGKGVYAAEMVTKADQYSDSRSARKPNGTVLYLILSRMLLGNVFLIDSSHPSVANKGSVKLTRPPCVHCLKDICGCEDQTLYDSVMGDGRWLFREFAVYEKNQCYPEYLIKYKRV